jgi:hypothetical protein
LIEEILCATIIIVLDLSSFLRLLKMVDSVLKSSAEKESSKINICGSLAMARAIESRCF